MNERWDFNESGVSSATPSYWFEFKAPDTGTRFVVSVFDAVGQDRAEALANEVVADAEVRRAARELTETGREHELVVRDDPDQAEHVTVWRKS